MTSMNQGLFSTTMEAEKRDPGNEVGARNVLIPLAYAVMLKSTLQWL